MPTEAELRRRMHAEEPTPAIDAATVIRLARRRRLPRRIALGATVSLAVVGLGIAGITGIQGLTPMGASDSAGGNADESASEGYGVVPTPAAEPTTCGSALPVGGASSAGLEIGTIFPDAVPPGGGEVTGTLTLRNTGDVRITGSTTAPTFTVLLNGVVVGYGNEPTPVEPVPLDLAPGETLRYETEATPVSCVGVGGGGPAAIEPGAYDLIAVIDFTPDPGANSPGSTARERLTTPREPITVE